MDTNLKIQTSDILQAIESGLQNYLEIYVQDIDTDDLDMDVDHIVSFIRLNLDLRDVGQTLAENYDESELIEFVESMGLATVDTKLIIKDFFQSSNASEILEKIKEYNSSDYMHSLGKKLIETAFAIKDDKIVELLDENEKLKNEIRTLEKRVEIVEKLASAE